MRFDEDDRGGVTVVVDGQPQSYVALDDPLLLAFDYVEHLALAIDAWSGAGAGAGAGSGGGAGAGAGAGAGGTLRVTHVGGAGLTLARWIAVTRPGSPQIVFEPDEELTAAVRSRLPLRRGHRVRVRPVDGRSGIRALADGSADVVVLDAYADGRVPADLVSVEFFEQVCRVLTSGGLCVANLADEPGLRHAARVVAAMGASDLGEVVLIAGHEVLKGRRFGNVVVAAVRAGPAPTTVANASQVVSAGQSPAAGQGASAVGGPGTGWRAERSTAGLAGLRRRVASASRPTGIRAGVEVTRWLAGARPWTDADAAPSPEPPDPGAWRLR